MNIFHGLSAALLIAAAGNVEASPRERDGEPTSGRETLMTLPSYRVLYKSPTKCEDVEQRRDCRTTRILEVLDTQGGQLKTDPITWIKPEETRQGRADNKAVRVMYIKVLKPSYTSVPMLYRHFIETTTCPSETSENCKYDFDLVDQEVRIIGPALE